MYNNSNVKKKYVARKKTFIRTWNLSRLHNFVLIINNANIFHFTVYFTNKIETKHG